jgi:hypothetical protein
MSEGLADASRELVARAVEFWKIQDEHKAETDRPMERAGRKANPIPMPEEASL